MQQCECGAAHEPGGAYYVTAIDDVKRTALLLGPYDSHPEALARVDDGRRLANDVDPRAPWYAYGTVRVLDSDRRPGALNDRLTAA